MFLSLASFKKKAELLIFASSCDLLRTDAMTKQLDIVSLWMYGNSDPWSKFALTHSHMHTIRGKHKYTLSHTFSYSDASTHILSINLILSQSLSHTLSHSCTHTLTPTRTHLHPNTHTRTHSDPFATHTRTHSYDFCIRV